MALSDSSLTSPRVSKKVAIANQIFATFKNLSICDNSGQLHDIAYTICGLLVAEFARSTQNTARTLFLLVCSALRSTISDQYRSCQLGMFPVLVLSMVIPQVTLPNAEFHVWFSTIYTWAPIELVSLKQVWQKTKV